MLAPGVEAPPIGHRQDVKALGGRYRLIEQIGSGGMSVVWRGYDDVLGRPVAVKVLSEGYACDAAFRERMRREARAAARLSHPQVNTVYDFGEDADAPYMVMELMGGPSLADELHDGPLLWYDAVAICADIAAGLASAHAAGLVHRDVKPGNVMLGLTGAKLVDFGISAEIGEPHDPAPDGTVLGTPAYVSPERLTGGPAQAASDVYALGLVLYRTLAGRLPWDVDTRTGVLRAHLLTKPAPLPPVPGLPREVARLCQRCLAKDPAARPDAGELARVWARAVTDRTETTVPLPGFGRRGTRAMRTVRGLAHGRRRLGFLATGIGLLTALAMITAFASAPDRPSTADPVKQAVEQTRAVLDAVPASCSVIYRVRSDDGRAFAGDLTVRNTGSDAIPDSTLIFTISGDQLVSGSGAPWTQDGTAVRVRAGPLAPGAQVVLPFQGTYHGTNALPGRFSLGDTECDPTLVGVSGAGALPTPTGGPVAGGAPAGTTPDPTQPGKDRKSKKPRK
ncbi:MAG: hypothetical protein AUI14_08435 [Actinobacteria bacterium 13_2_20CM_2_71_6]|nr:MAG: hypothetical protein AUI14_08435 [Actinobacteria bacterium 13_2_20CM_2_71_6]